MDENTENYFGLGYRRQSETHRTRSHTNQSKAIMLIKQSLVEMINISWWWRSNELTCIISTGTLSSIKNHVFDLHVFITRKSQEFNLKWPLVFSLIKRETLGPTGRRWRLFIRRVLKFSSWFLHFFLLFLFLGFGDCLGPETVWGFAGIKKKKRKKNKTNRARLWFSERGVCCFGRSFVVGVTGFPILLLLGLARLVRCRVRRGLMNGVDDVEFVDATTLAPPPKKFLRRPSRVTAAKCFRNTPDDRNRTEAFTEFLLSGFGQAVDYPSTPVFPSEGRRK